MLERDFPLQLTEPIRVERVKLDHPVSDIKKHFHSYYELFFLVDGEFDYFIDNNTYHITPFNIIFLSPNTLHKPLIPEKCSYERILVYFNKDIIIDEDIAKQIDVNNKVISLPVNTSKSIFKTLCIMLQDADKDILHYPYLQSLLNEIIITVLRNLENVSPKKTSENFKIVIDYIRANFTESITLKDVAERFYLNPSYLSRIFKKNTGFTYIEYVNYQRIIYAQSLLLNTNQQIADIAMKSGFDSLTHFGRVFKQLTGVSPRSYRKQLS